MLIELLTNCNLLNENCTIMSNLEKLKKSSSPEVSTSISDFLEQERLCKELCSTIASDVRGASANSVRGKDFPRCDSALNISDLSDDDIGSILEKMSQIVSPSKSSQDSGSMSNSLYDSKQDRNIEDILQEAEVLMQETVKFQPPNLTNPNVHLELSNPSRSHSPINRISTQIPGKDNTSLPQKTEDIYSSLGRSNSSRDESKGISKELSLSCSVSFKSNQSADVSEKRKSHSSDLRGREEQRKPFYLHDQSSTRQVPHLNRTFLVNPAAVNESSEYTTRMDTLKKNVLVELNSRVDSDEDSEEKCFREFLSKTPAERDRESVLSTQHQEELTRKAEEMYIKLNEEIKIEIEEIIKSKAAKVDGVGTPIQTPTLNGDFPNLKLSYPGLETPSVEVPSCFNLEKEFLEERKRCLKLKADLEWIGRLHADEMTQLEKQHNEEMLALKKEVVLLTAQLSEKIPLAPFPNTAKESERHKVEMLEKEMAEQEVLLAGYQRENELLCAELRSVKKLLKKLMGLLRKEP